MNISELFIQRPVTTTLVMLGILVFGTMAYRVLPVSDLPAVDFPTIQVNASLPGASPETMASTVALPLEKQFAGIAGLSNINSVSQQGNTNITLQFDLSRNIDAAAQDVQAMIGRTARALPPQMPAPPSYQKANPGDQSVILLILRSPTLPLSMVDEYAQQTIAQRLSMVDGVAQVDVFGSQKYAVRIDLDPRELAARSIGIDTVANAVTNANSNVPTGTIYGDKTFVVQTNGQLMRAAGYGSTIVAYRNGNPVRLDEVAHVFDGVENDKSAAWQAGERCVMISIRKQPGTNVVEVVDRIKALLPAMREQLPAAMSLDTRNDRSATIRESVHDVKITLLATVGLVVLVIFLFLRNLSATLIPSLALPASLVGTFTAMYLLGYSLDNLSLMAITLAIGFLVDDAIVFLENTVRLMEEGQNALDASLNSAKEISFTILTMTLSLAAVFIPLVFMSGLVGRIFREFSITIVVSILASGIVSLTLTPLMTSRLLSGRGAETKKTWMERVIGGAEHRVLDVYGRWLWFFLRHRWISAVTWGICLVGTGYLFYTVPKSFLPVGDSSFIRGVLVAQEGSSPEQMHRYQDEAEKVMHANPAVAATFTMSGNGQFMPSNQAFLISFLTDPSKRAPIDKVAGQLMGGIMSTVPGALTFLQPNPVLEISTGATANVQGQFAYALSGIDPNQVYDAANKMVAKMHEYPGFLFVNSDLFNHTPNLQVDILRDQAKLYGVSETRILTLLHDAYSQNYSYLIKKTTDQYQVILEVADDQRSDPQDLGRLYIKSDDGQRMIPLNAVTSWHSIIGPQAVNHINQFTSVTLFFNMKPGFTVGQATNFVETSAKQILPPDVHGELQGEALTFRNTVSDLVVLMLVAVFVMYVILAILYESYLHPITVLSSLPVALVGGLLTLWLFGAEASLYAYIGMFMLMGIVKKNGIMIVDFAEQRVRQGIKDDQAIHDASMERFRPIMMTTMAALLGALPIALGYGADGSSRRPLGLVVIGGLIVSQFVTLFVTPAIYLYLEEFQEKVLDRFSFFRSSRAGRAQSHVPAPAYALQEQDGD
jgi:HAE1 family hydrophobic/amphiphilic exporter-1